LGLDRVPCVRVDHLSDVEERVLRAAINRLGEKGEWDVDELKLEFEELVLTETPLEISGFSIMEIDQVLHEEVIDGLEKGPVEPEANKVAVARLGDVFVLGGHKIICGDAREPAVLAEVSKDDPPVGLVLTDPPYNVKIEGNVTRGNHSEFVMASGEMSDDEFLRFNEAWMGAALPLLRDGGVFGAFIDWRGNPIIHAAATKTGLAALNLIVWTKTNAGMGSLYRSQHELLPLFKNGTAPHVNNVSLGSKGRWRSNVWNYPGASTIGSDARRGLKDHPTVKPTAMLEDALLDITNRGDIVLDPFLGSGSTLMAAEKTGRVCRGIELDPLYIDVIVRRYESFTGNTAILVETGETFAALAGRRAGEAAAGAPSKVDGEGATAALA
jgi:DNA modification methylase